MENPTDVQPNQDAFAAAPSAPPSPGVETLARANQELRLLVEKQKAELDQAYGQMREEMKERRKLELAFHESEGRFLAFMNNSPTMAFIKDEKGRYVYGNQRWHSFFAHQPAPGAEQTDFHLYPKKTAALVRREDREILARGKCSESVRNHRAEDGRFHPWLVVKFPILDPHGRSFIGGVGVDITERNRAEEALRHSENMLADFFDNAPLGLHWLGPDGRILRANKAELSMFGYPAEEYIGQHVSRFHVDEHSLNHLLNRLRNNTPGTHEARVRCKDGSIKHVLIDANVFRENARFVHARCFTRNVTDRHQRERQILEISEREQQRLGEDLHDELCQYLAAIKFKNGLLAGNLRQNSPTDARQAAAIEDMLNTAIERAHGLARGLHPVQLEADELSSALKELAANFSRVYHVNCVCQIRKPVLIHENAVHLYRIAQEAVTNAIKHGKARKILVSLSVKGDCISLSIKDDGLGFPPKPSTKTGMGLHIMKYRARMIGAGLTVVEAVRGGILITCTLPRPNPKPPDAKTRPTKRP